MRIVFAVSAAIGPAIVCAPPAGAITGFESCPMYGRYRIDAKNVACGDAWLVDVYDWQGAKLQRIENYDCYSDTVDVKPVVLTCVSADGELVVSE